MKLLDVETIHEFGVVDRFEHGWSSELSLEAEVHKQQAYLRIHLYQRKWNSHRSVGFPVCVSADTRFNTRNAIDYFRQIERCWQGKLGKEMQRGRISRFLDQKLFGIESSRVLDTVPTVIHPPFSTQRLECLRHSNGLELCSLSNRRHKRSSGGSLISFPRSSLAKIIEALEGYTSA